MSAPFDKDAYKPLQTFAFEALSVAGSAVGFTAATYAPAGTAGGPAIMAKFSVEGAQVRYRLDGTNPTSAVGEILNPGDEVVVWGTMDIASFRAISTGATATLNTHYAR